MCKLIVPTPSWASHLGARVGKPQAWQPSSNNGCADLSSPTGTSVLRSPSGKHVGRSLQKADAAFLDFSRRRYGIPLNVIHRWLEPSNFYRYFSGCYCRSQKYNVTQGRTTFCFSRTEKPEHRWIRKLPLGPCGTIDLSLWVASGGSSSDLLRVLRQKWESLCHNPPAPPPMQLKTPEAGELQGWRAAISLESRSHRSHGVCGFAEEDVLSAKKSNSGWHGFYQCALFHVTVSQISL